MSEATTRARVLIYGPDGRPIGALASTRPNPADDSVAARLEARGLLGMVDGVCALRGVTREEVCGRGRTKAVREARAEVWFLMRTWPERAYSLPEIGAVFDRDHATVYSGIKGHVERIVGKP